MTFLLRCRISGDEGHDGWDCPVHARRTREGIGQPSQGYRAGSRRGGGQLPPESRSPADGESKPEHAAAFNLNTQAGLLTPPAPGALKKTAGFLSRATFSCTVLGSGRDRTDLENRKPAGEDDARATVRSPLRDGVRIHAPHPGRLTAQIDMASSCLAARTATSKINMDQLELNKARPSVMITAARSHIEAA